MPPKVHYLLNRRVISHVREGIGSYGNWMLRMPLCLSLAQPASWMRSRPEIVTDRKEVIYSTLPGHFQLLNCYELRGKGFLGYVSLGIKWWKLFSLFHLQTAGQKCWKPIFCFRWRKIALVRESSLWYRPVERVKFTRASSLDAVCLSKSRSRHKQEHVFNIYR